MSGLEALGVAASIIQVADAGLRVAEVLYSYAESVASADKRLDYIVSNVSLTSRIVRDIGELFAHKETATFVAEAGVQTATDCAEQCALLFAEFDELCGRARYFISKSSQVRNDF